MKMFDFLEDDGSDNGDGPENNGNEPEYDAAVSRWLKEKGMNQALNARAAIPFKFRATFYLNTVPIDGEVWSDKVTRVTGLPSRGPNKNNSTGAWFSAQAKSGRLVFTGRYVKSERDVRHAGDQRVWRKVR